jgi:hypothetical protein
MHDHEPQTTSSAALTTTTTSCNRKVLATTFTYLQVGAQRVPTELEQGCMMIISSSAALVRFGAQGTSAGSLPAHTWQGRRFGSAGQHRIQSPAVCRLQPTAATLEG